MCNYKILSHNENGYIILCHCCKHYQLAFGTTAVTFEPSDFKKFGQRVGLLKEITPCDGFVNQKRIPIEIFNKGVMMVLNYAELLNLETLLGEAFFSNEMDLLIEDLNLRAL